MIFFLGGGRGVYEARRRGGIRYMEPTRGGGEVKTKPEMKRPYWVRSSSIAWSLTVTKIDPERRNKLEKYSAKLHMIADSGAMCSVLNYEAAKLIG